jgi:hypothetical protein
MLFNKSQLDSLSILQCQPACKNAGQVICSYALVRIQTPHEGLDHVRGRIACTGTCNAL